MANPTMRNVLYTPMALPRLLFTVTLEMRTSTEGMIMATADTLEAPEDKDPEVPVGEHEPQRRHRHEEEARKDEGFSLAEPVAGVPPEGLAQSEDEPVEGDGHSHQELGGEVEQSARVERRCRGGG